MIVDELKKAILQYAIQGKLTKQLKTDSDVEKTIEEINCIKQRTIKKSKSDDSLIDEVPFEIPSNWKWVKFENITSLLTCGYASTPQYVEDGMPFISAKNVKPYNFMPADHKKISYDLYNKLTKTCKPEKNDILLTRVGAGIGESAIIDIEMDFAIYVSLTLIKLVDYSLINNKYILYWLNSPSGIHTALNNIYGKSSSQGNLNVKNVRNFLIPLPPIEEQQRIVDKIEELFNRLDKLKDSELELTAMKSKLPDEIKKSILQYAFDGNLYYDSSTDEWNSDKIIDCCREVVTGNSISASIKKSKYLNLENGYDYIATKDLGFNNEFDYENGVKIPFSEKNFKIADINDILMCIEGGSAGKKIGILTKKVCYGNKLCKFSVDDSKVIPKFLYYYLQSPKFIKEFSNNLSGIIGGVSINKLKMMNLEYPSIEEQKRIVEKIEKLLPLIESL